MGLIRQISGGMQAWMRVAAWLVLAGLIGPVAAATAVPTPPAAARKTLVFAGGTDFPPYEFIDSQGQASGFDVDIADMDDDIPF